MARVYFCDLLVKLDRPLDTPPNQLDSDVRQRIETALMQLLNEVGQPTDGTIYVDDRQASVIVDGCTYLLALW